MVNAADRTPTGDDRSIGELISQLSEQTSQLVRDEMQLARAEMTAKAKHAGTGVGLFGGAGVLGLYGVGALIAAAIAGLSLVVEVWLAALIVAVVLFALAGIAALIGRKETRRATPTTPERTVDNLKRDVEELKEAGSR